MHTHLIHTTRPALGLIAALTLALTGCAAAERPPEKVIVVPSTATTMPAYNRDGSIPKRRYVVRMSDGQRDWEVEFPEVATSYELRIPLKKEDDGLLVEGEQLTEADRQLLENLRRKNVGTEREGIYENGKNKADPKGRNQVGGLDPGAELDPKKDPADPAAKATNSTKNAKGGVDPWAGKEDKPAPSRQSYFLGIEKVKRLYRARKYELAVVFLKKLEADYPNDVQIMSMMGTLWLKLNQPDLAQKYWEDVLKVDPNNKAVRAGLKQLTERRGEATPAPASPPAPLPETRRGVTRP